MGVTNFLAITLITVFTALGVILAKFLFGRWFNPLSLYSVIWAFCLCAYETQLIRWHRISPEAWAYMVIAWLCLFMGAASVLAFRKPPKPAQPINIRRLRQALIALSLVEASGIVDQVFLLIRTFGSLGTALFQNAVAIYGERTTGDLTWIPYVGAFSFSASALAGIYTAKRGKFTFIGLLPIFLITIQSILAMSRFGFVLGLLLFFVSFLCTRKEIKFSRAHKRIGIAVAILVMFSGFLFVSLARDMGTYEGSSPLLAKIEEVAPIFSNIYTNFAGPPVAFTMYLEAHEHERSWWGMYTFAPFFRVLSRFGFDSAVPPYEEAYDTPVWHNTLTYLKNLHSDFGPLGVVVGPFLLGMFAGMLHQRMHNPLCVVLLSFLYTVLTFSFMFSVTVLGDWYIGLFVAVPSMAWVQRKPTRRVNFTISPCSPCPG